MEYSWVDRQTRAVIVSLNMYNGNFDYYCQSTFMLEFSPGGTVVPRATLKL
jgi:Polycystin cation channel.